MGVGVRSRAHLCSFSLFRNLTFRSGQQKEGFLYSVVIHLWNPLLQDGLMVPGMDGFQRSLGSLMELVAILAGSRPYGQRQYAVVNDREER